MTAKQFQEKFPYLWGEVYDGVKNDFTMIDDLESLNLTDKHIERIAFNAAFIACDALYRQHRTSGQALTNNLKRELIYEPKSKH